MATGENTKSVGDAAGVVGRRIDRLARSPAGSLATIVVLALGGRVWGIDPRKWRRVDLHPFADEERSE